MAKGKRGGYACQRLQERLPAMAASSCAMTARLAHEIGLAAPVYWPTVGPRKQRAAGHWLGDEVALCLIGTGIDEKIPIRFTLNAFCDDFEAEAVREFDARTHYGSFA